MATPRRPDHQWLRTFDEALETAIQMIDAARRSVRFEVYIYTGCPIGERFRDALARAARRGAEVRVLLDAFGSLYLPQAFWDPVATAGGTVRRFNPITLERFNIRDHRKLLVCDDEVAIVGGYNIASECAGDGIHSGWRDLGLRLSGALVTPLAASFDALFELADVRHERFPRLRKSRARSRRSTPDGDLFLSGPGRGPSPFRDAVREELARAQEVDLIQAYFLPPTRLRRSITQVARRGGRVRLICAGKSDVPLIRDATRSLYRRLLRGRVSVYEYLPQVLHTKFIRIDSTVYVGSLNLEPRSLALNYELLLRFEGPEWADDGRRIFDEHLAHSQPIELKPWWQSRSWWDKLRERLASFLFLRIDPWITRYQLRGFR